MIVMNKSLFYKDKNNKFNMKEYEGLMIKNNYELINRSFDDHNRGRSMSDTNNINKKNNFGKNNFITNNNNLNFSNFSTFYGERENYKK